MPEYQSDLVTWHYSRLKEYRGTPPWSAGCPAREQLRRNGEPSIPTAAMRRGTQVHEGAARCLRAAIDAGRTVVPKEAAEQIAAGYDEEVGNILRAFVDEVRVPVKADPLYIEQPFETELPNGELFAGTLDLAYCEVGVLKENPFASSPDRVTIMDWKTFAPPFMDEKEPPWQLLCYAYLYQRRHPEAKNIRGGIGAMQPFGGWRVAMWDLSDKLAQTEIINEKPVSKIGLEIAAKVETVKTDAELRPNVGGACLSCNFIHACPCKDTATLEAICGDGAGGKLRKYLWHKAQMKALRGLLNTHVKECGEIPEADGATWGYNKPTCGYEVLDYPGLVALAQEAEDALKTPRSRLPGVARLLKLEKDVARALIESEEWKPRAEAVLMPKELGKPTLGLRLLDDTADEPEEG